ncbi:probable hydrolase PNKD [Pelobates cultripes]|nr:probable hydrolase PNKD [Pelobates cultripes]
MITTMWRQSTVRRSLQNAKSLHSSSRYKAKPKVPGPMTDGPEYIPTRQAKNPMKKVGLAWAVGFPSGIILFLLAKNEVDKRRLEQLKVRQRMKDANQGQYERERFSSTP